MRTFIDHVEAKRAESEEKVQKPKTNIIKRKSDIPLIKYFS